MNDNTAEGSGSYLLPFLRRDIYFSQFTLFRFSSRIDYALRVL